MPCKHSLTSGPLLVRHFLGVPQRERPATFTATARIRPGVSLRSAYAT
jgi:hypothetical protein